MLSVLWEQYMWSEPGKTIEEIVFEFNIERSVVFAQWREDERKKTLTWLPVQDFEERLLPLCPQGGG